MAKPGRLALALLASVAGAATAIGATVAYRSSSGPDDPSPAPGGSKPAQDVAVRDGVQRYDIPTSATGAVQVTAIIAGRGADPLRLTPDDGVGHLLVPRVAADTRRSITFPVMPRSGELSVRVQSTKTSDQLISLGVAEVPFKMGVSTEGLPASTAALDTWERVTGVKPELTLTFTSFLYDLDGRSLQALHARTGAVPVITLEPWDPTRPTVNAFPLTNIAAGQYDSYLRRQAATIQSLGFPVVVRFAHEMNGNWFPWGYGVQGGLNTGTEYVDAWRHVHDVMNSVAPGKITWAWTPAAWDSSRQPDYASLYPGDRYVDWTGLSAYIDYEDTTWAKRIQPSITRLDEVAPAKPILFAEAGVLPGPNRPTQLADLISSARGTPRAIGLIYFDIVGRYDWRLDRDPAGVAALTRDGQAGGSGTVSSR